MVFLKDKGIMGGKNKILIQSLAIGKKLDVEHYKSLAEITEETINAISGERRKISGFIRLFDDRSIKDAPDKPLYKYVSRDIWENFLSHGKFRFGTLDYYRNIERMESRDRLEGLVNLFIETEKNSLHAKIICEGNSYIFCGTQTISNNSKMKKSFGNYLVKINKPRAFARTIAKALGTEKFHIQKILYSDLKIYKKFSSYEVFDCERPALTDFLFNSLQETSQWASIFIKPRRYEKEEETRIAFVMEDDSYEPKDIDCKEALRFIELISNA